MAVAAAGIQSNAEIERELRTFGSGDPRILALYLFGSVKFLERDGLPSVESRQC
jgi:hypothetical protein